MESTAITFLNMINKERISIECFWIDIGKSLYSIFKGLREGLTLWKDFSGNALSSKCERVYPDLNYDNKLSIKTLAWYARIDSEKQYTKYCSVNVPVSMAQSFKNLYWLDLVSTSTTYFDFYYYKNHGWNHIKNKNDFYQIYDTKLSESIIKELSMLLYDKDFISNIDNNLAYFRTSNGVIKQYQGKNIFRDGKPEDYVVNTTHIEYMPHYHLTHPVVIQTKDFIHNLIHNETLEDAFYKEIASFLHGHPDKTINLWSGVNMSPLFAIFKLVFGDYFLKTSTRLFRGNLDSTFRSKENYKLNGKRLLVIRINKKIRTKK